MDDDRALRRVKEAVIQLEVRRGVEALRKLDAILAARKRRLVGGRS